MSLSENERRRLEKLEKELAAADPGLDRKLRSGALVDRARLYSVCGVLAVMVGMAVVISGIISRLTIIGGVGFVLMLAGGHWFVTGLRLRRRSGPGS
ncbi:DUF3040 domain-containing protein [Pseudarthrobacter phenanthrenivorans]|uniref:DUF3040 domain-containing protein n=1 Tax=Pseudarthrobacter phenanthrenivorans TaxID=361575 RepID=UPI002F35F202